MFEILSQYGVYYWKGILVTLGLSFFSLILGSMLGVVLSLLSLSRVKILNVFSKIYISIFRGTPLFMQLTMINLGLFMLLNKAVSPFVAGLIAVSLNSSAYVSEIIRSGIQSIDKGQTEAGRSLGLSSRQTMVHIILPQAIKNILPALGNEFITLIKETSIVSKIGVADLMYGAEKVNSMTYQFSSLVLAAVFYWIITTSLSKLIGLFERRLSYND